MTFTVDHKKLKKGIYKDEITYDIRTVVPYKEPLMSNVCMHSIEHILAVKLNEKINKIYFGPMGCQTGFYLLSDNKPEEVYQALYDASIEALNEKTVPFKSRAECGNYFSLDFSDEVKEKLEIIKDLAKEILDNPGCFVYPIIE